MYKYPSDRLAFLLGNKSCERTCTDDYVVPITVTVVSYLRGLRIESFDAWRRGAAAFLPLLISSWKSSMNIQSVDLEVVLGFASCKALTI